LVYSIEIITFINGKTIINCVKRDTVGVEYGYLFDFSSIEEAERTMRHKWEIQGNIRLVKNGIYIGVLNGSL